MSVPPSDQPVVLITGASRGIGAACAHQLAQEGWFVLVNYVSDHAAAQGVVDAIQSAGGRAHALAADVGCDAAVTTLFQTLDHVAGRLDALVNNAGILGAPCAAADLDAAAFLPVFQTNLFGSIRCIREATRRMSTQRGGRGGAIVNVSSTATRNGGLPEHALYTASKGALESLTVALSRELGPQGIRINSVRPGIINTDIHRPRGGLAMLEPLAAGIPLGRLGQPDDVAQAVAWLVSERARFVHGSCLDVAGGR